MAFRRGTSGVTPPTGKRNRGRPPTPAAVRLSAIAWSEAVAIRARVRTSYALEKLFADEPHKAQIALGLKTGSWKKYRSGRVPQPRVVEIVELRFPGTRIWLSLGLWELLNVPAPTPARIMAIVSTLPSDIATLIEQLDLHPGGYEIAVLELLERADVEALMGLAAVIQLAQHQLRVSGSEHIASVKKLAVAAFLNLLTKLAAVELPFENIFERTYEHAQTHFTANAARDHLNTPSKLALLTAIRIRYMAILFTMANIIEPTPIAWRAFIMALHRTYVFQLAKVAPLLEQVVALEKAGTLNAAKRLPAVRKILRHLRQVPRHSSCLDASSASVACAPLPCSTTRGSKAKPN